MVRPDPTHAINLAAPMNAASIEALASRCVRCALCLPHCPTYALDQQEAESPRGRISLGLAIAGGLDDPVAARHIDQCLACRNCEPVCPANVEFGEFLVATRAALVARGRGNRIDQLVAALAAFPRLAGTLLRLQRTFTRRGDPARAWRAALRHGFARPTRSAAPTERPGWLIFTGCFASGVEKPLYAAVSRLAEPHRRVTLMPPACCGAIARHAGAVDHVPALAARLTDLEREYESRTDEIIVTATGCVEDVARSLRDAPVVELCTALDALLPVEPVVPAGQSPQRVAIQMPCSHRNVVGDPQAARRLLSRLAGVTLVEVGKSGCCGGAGTHGLRHPARAAAIGAPLVDEIVASGAELVCSSNIGCRLQLEALLAQRGLALPVLHPAELLAAYWPA